MAAQDLFAVGAILEQLAAGDLTEEVAAERLGWALDGQTPTCETCATFRLGHCVFPGRPARPEDPASIACHDYRKYDPRDEALPVTPQRPALSGTKRSGSRMFK